jgi:hypothetical protein
MSAYDPPANSYVIGIARDSMPERLKPKYSPTLINCDRTSNSVRVADVVTQNKLSSARFSSLPSVEKILQNTCDPFGVAILRASKTHCVQNTPPYLFA